MYYLSALSFTRSTQDTNIFALLGFVTLIMIDKNECYSFSQNNLLQVL